MRRTTNKCELCFADVLKNQQFMYAVIISILIFLTHDNTILANAQTNSKSNVTTTISAGNSNPGNIAITHGIASGDVTNHSAIIWSKSNKNSLMDVWYDTNPNITNPKISQQHPIVNQSTDVAGQVKLDPDPGRVFRSEEYKHSFTTICYRIVSYST